MNENPAGGGRFGVSQFTTAPWTFEDDLARLPGLQVDAIEIVEDKLDPVRWVEQLSEVATSGMAISGFQPSVRTIYPSRMMPEPTDLGERRDRLRQSIERLAPFAPGATFMVSTGAHPDGDMAEAMRTTAGTLRELGAVAADHGVMLALEPLNPSSVNVESAIWTVDQALDVISQADRPKVGLCLDFWNIWQNDEVAAQIGRAAGRILTVQLGDWRIPRSFADRIALGDGVLPLTSLIAATRAAGYEGPYVLELFHDDIHDAPKADDIAAIIERSRSAFEAAWASS